MSTRMPADLSGAVPMRRIIVVGAPGAGKTTLAQHLAARLSLPFVDLDALFWGPAWTPASPPAFRERVATTVAHDAWALSGNYGVARDLIWHRADTLIWLGSWSRLLEGDSEPAQVAAAARALLRQSGSADPRVERLEQYLTQPFFCAETYTDIPGAHVPRAVTLRDVAAICAGVWDHVEPRALRFQGGLA